MRISPTSFMLWEKDKKEFWIKYKVAPGNNPPQTAAMAAGSGFDAYVKAAILGAPVDGILKEQVEEHNVDFAHKAGCELFEFYKNVSGYERFLHEAGENSIDVVGDLITEFPNFTLRGKPDAYYMRNGHPVILDWKVNGFMSQASPAPGYVWDSKTGMAHKDAKLSDQACRDETNCLSRFKREWAVQLSIYAWCIMKQFVTPFHASIDQITKTSKGELRLTRYRNNVSVEFQDALLIGLNEMAKDIKLQTSDYCAKYSLDQEDIESWASASQVGWLNALRGGAF